MKAFIASRVSGEDKDKLLVFLGKLQEHLRRAGVEPYITELAPPQTDDGNKLVRAFKHIDECRALIVVYKKGAASEGMSAEVGYAYGRYPVWIYAEAGTESNLFALADKLEYWTDENDLFNKVGGAT